MEKSSDSNFSKKDLFSRTASVLTTGALSASALFAGLNFHQSRKNMQKEKEKEKAINYLLTTINPRTMRLEKAQDGNGLYSFAAWIPGLVSVIGSSAGIVGIDRAIDYYTSPERRAKKKIEEKYKNKYKSWEEERKVDYKSGLISTNEFVLEKKKKRLELKNEMIDEYQRWVDREEFIRDASRGYYESLQKKTPEKVENFSLFKDFAPKQQSASLNTNSNVVMSPDVTDFLKLDIGRGLLKGGASLVGGILFRENKIKDTVKKLILLEMKIDSMKNIPLEKKELIKIDAFKSILSKFNNMEDIEKILILKEKYKQKLQKKN